MRKFYKLPFIYIAIFFLLLSLQTQKNANAQWVQMSSGIGNNEYPQCLASTGSTILAGMSALGVYRSTNNGANWLTTSLNNQSIFSFYISGGTVYACTGNGIYTSTNSGETWSASYLTGTSISCVIISGGFIHAGGAGVRTSSNNGVSWEQTLASFTIVSLASSGGSVFAAAVNSGVFKSTNNGANFTLTSLSGVNPTTLLVSGSAIYAGTQFSGLYNTLNNGTNWTQVSATLGAINSLVNQETYYFAGRDLNAGVWLSSNGGSTWVERNQGFPGVPSVMAVCYHNGFMFAAAYGLSIWRRGYSEIIAPTSVYNVSNEVPDKFSLSQNYPNPFNPSTRINYELKITNYVTLKVFDLQGKEVASLVNERQSAGSYAVDFNTSDFSLPSGIYFYTLNAGEFTETRKMILIK